MLVVRTIDPSGSFSIGVNLANELFNYIRHAIGEKSTVVVPLSEIEKLGGDDWLLEISAHAEQLKIEVMPHPTDISLLVVARNAP